MFKVGDRITHIKYPGTMKRLIVSVDSYYYHVQFNNETVATLLDKKWVETNWRKLTKLELALQ